MPIPQLKRRSDNHTKQSAQELVRDASLVRKKRAAERKGKKSYSFLRRVTNNQSPEDEKKSSGRRRRITKKGVLKIFTLLFVGGGILCVLAVVAAYVWVSKDLASIEDLDKRVVDQSTKIYARDGETLLYEIGDNKRTDVSFDQISDDIKAATIALEDRDFYNHSGFKITSFIRAGIKSLIPGHIAAGTSTLTQQFIKNAVLTSERTYTRKLKELILAIRLERKYSKDKILEMYLNEVYYGPNYQGVETAAREYFNKSAKDVTLAESATIAALPKDPVALPHDPKRLQDRRDYALDQMVKLNMITEEEASVAKSEELKMNTEVVTGIKAPHFVFFVRSYLEKQYGQNKVNKGGLKVITTLDWDKQQKAEQAVVDGMPKVEQYGGSNAGLVSLDAHNGQILAMVGSRDFFDEKYDGQVNVTTSALQPGSSFKPIVYLTAFTKGYTPDTVLYDVETDFPTQAEGKYHPHNYDMTEHGPISLRRALAQSYNIPAVKLLYLVGVDEALNMAENLGYTTLADRSRFGLSLVLGGAEVTLLEHTASYATFAREGEYHPPSGVLRVEEKSGDVLEEWHDNPRVAVDKEPVRALNDILSDSGARAPTFSRLTFSDRPVAVKTGTTNSFHDAWTMGYTPSVATGVWVGNNDNTEMNRGADGSVIAAPIWKAYMENVLKGTPVENFKKSNITAATEILGGKMDGTKKVKVDSVTGERISDECLSTYPPQYIGEKEYKETHTILHYLNRNDPKGSPPENPRDDPMYEAWETAVVLWTKKDEQRDVYFSDDLPSVPCSLRDKKTQPGVRVTSPSEGELTNRQTLFLAALVTPGQDRIITKISYIIDVVTVETKTDLTIKKESPVRSSYKPKNLTNGKHSLTIRIEDDFGNFAEQTTAFTYQSNP